MDDSAFWPTVLGAVLGAALGSIGSFLITRWFARASDRQIRQIARVFAQIAEDRGMAEWVRDKDGNITFGRVIRIALSDNIRAEDGLQIAGHPPTIRAQPATTDGEGDVQRK